MAEKTVPWWRRALSFALGGIRSGFGLFPRFPKLDPAQVPKEEQQPTQQQPPNPVQPPPQVQQPTPVQPPTQAQQVLKNVEAPEEPEEVLEEEPPLPKQPANPPTPAAAQAVPPEPVSFVRPPVQPAVIAAPPPEPVPEPHVEPTAESAPEPAVEVAVEPVSEPAPEPAVEVDLVPVSEPAPEPAPVIAAPEPIASVEEEETLDTSQPVPQPEPVAQIPAEPEADSEPEPELDTVEEALSDPQPEALKLTVDPSVIPAVAAVAEATPAPNPADAPEPPPAIAVDESAPEPQTAPEPLAEPEAAPVPSPAPAQESLPEPQPGPAAAIAPNSEPTPEPAPEPVVDEKAAARLAPRQKRLDDADEESPFSVVVDKVYDGPLDLLLDLIRKQDIDIYDIPIAKITAQFLAYVNQLKASDVDVAGEFIYTASLLIHIKSRMLLPRAPSGPDDTPEDPRRELVERLLEHERFKNAAQMLQQKQMLEAASWTNPGAREFKDDDVTEPEIAADTVDLVRIFRDILERARTRPVIDVTEDSVTVGQMIQFLARRLTMEDKPVALRRLLSHTRSERALIAMFLALLELVRLQAILLRQDRQFSEIFIKKHTGFDTVMNEGLANARDDWR